MDGISAFRTSPTTPVSLTAPLDPQAFQQRTESRGGTYSSETFFELASVGETQILTDSNHKLTVNIHPIRSTSPGYGEGTGG